LAAQKHQNFGFRDLIATDIVDRKTVLETAITPLRATKFGELWSTNGETSFRPTQSTFSDAHIVDSEFFIHFGERGVSAVQGHPRSLILVPIESAYATSY